MEILSPSIVILLLGDVLPATNLPVSLHVDRVLRINDGT